MNTAAKKTQNLIISKMCVVNKGVRLYWDGVEFKPTYLQGGNIGMVPKKVSIEEYIALRKANPGIFQETGLLNGKEMCKYSISMCNEMLN